MATFPENWHIQKRQIEAGHLTATCLVRNYLERIDSRNSQINALSDVLERSALDTAKSIVNRSVTAPLAGLCLVVKDMIDVAQAHCSGGLDYFKGRIAEQDSSMVADLKMMGATIIGMAVSDTGGFGIRTPNVMHPQDQRRIVGGSSGGSAAAVAAGFVPVSLGTDSGGSIRIPAACCLLTGFKPTWGRFSTNGILPFAPTTDHVGLIANTVEDIKLVLAALDRDISKFSHNSQLDNAITIGVDERFYSEAEETVKQSMSDVEVLFRSLGWKTRKIKLPHPDEISDIHDIIVAKEATDLHARYFTQNGDLQKPVVLSTIEFGSTISPAQYKNACQLRTKLQQRIDRIFREVDYLILPTMPCLPPLKEDVMLKLGEKLFPIDAFLKRYTSLFNLSRHPVASLPVKTISSGVGVSLQLAGPHYADRQLLDFASKLESVLR